MITPYCGDNVNMCHNLKFLINEKEHTLVYCQHCKRRMYVKPQDKRRWSMIFRKDTLQPGGINLYYKYYGKMKVF